MGVEENSRQPSAADLDALRRRVDWLEQEVAALRQGSAVFAPPPRASAAPVVRVDDGDPAALLPLLPALPEGVANGPAAPPRASLENRLGSQVFNRIGIVAVLIATALFLKLAIDNHWVGPVGRVLIGLLGGAGIIVWSERFRRQGVTAFSYSLKAVGSGVLYLSLWAAFQLYHLLPAPVALGAMILVTAWNAFMAWSQDAELLAGYALIGGCVTPLLLSTGGDHEVFLFTYLLAIDVATVVLVRLKGWLRLLPGAFTATVLYFIGWFSSFYGVGALSITALFVVLFGAAFMAASIDWPHFPERRTAAVAIGRSWSGSSLRGILLPLANAAFVSLALYSVLEDWHHHATLPWLMVGLAAAYLGVMRLPQGRTVSAIHLSLAVVFLTIAVPLKASGHWITVAWLVEGAALFWVATRLRSAAEERPGEAGGLRDDTVLRWLAGGALVPGFLALSAVPYWFNPAIARSFFNHDVATALIGVVAFGGVAWLAWREGQEQSRSRPLAVVVLAMVAVDLIAILLALREILISHFVWLARTAFGNADFFSALVGVAILGAVAYVALRISREVRDVSASGRLAGGSGIAMNLVAILACVREIGSLWRYSAKNPSDGLKQALAVSAFLMVYSAMLLAVGFWKRSAFIRWQGLVLLVFTIAKTFLYDMSSLSQGYRVVSFFGLGVLLMAVSFAYQKDWLGLRDEPVAKEQR